MIERFPDVLTALERHAEIARDFREAGWRVLAHMHPKTVGATA